MKLLILFCLMTIFNSVTSDETDSEIPEEVKQLASIIHADFYLVKSSYPNAHKKVTIRANPYTDRNNTMKTIRLIHHVKMENSVFEISEYNEYGYSKEKNKPFGRFAGIKESILVEWFGFPNDTLCDLLYSREEGPKFIGIREKCSYVDPNMYEESIHKVTCNYFTNSGPNAFFHFRIKNRIPLPEEWRPKNPPCPV